MTNFKEIKLNADLYNAYKAECKRDVFPENNDPHNPTYNKHFVYWVVSKQNEQLHNLIDSKNNIANQQPRMIPAIPPESYTGSISAWSVNLKEIGLWNGNGWYGDVMLPEHIYIKLLNMCEDTGK